MSAIQMGVVGASGRMGKMILASMANHSKVAISQAFVPSWSDKIGIDVGDLINHKPTGVMVSALSADSPCVQVLIDFSLPTALDDVLSYCIHHCTPLVMGVTGLSDEQEQTLKQAAQHIAIVYAGNYSTGVNLSLNLLATTAKTLGLDADVEIIESHHKHKVDAPSGTALMMAKTITAARCEPAELVNGRTGRTPRKAGEIGIHAVRGGEIIGEHTVKFIMDGEIVEITHKAQNRATFADGAVRAALWLVDKPAGLYDMQDVLGLK